MAKKEETIFKEKVLPEIKKLGYFVKIQQASICGTPDILGTINGVFIAIELKTEEGSTSALQDLNIAKVIKNGGIGLVVTPSNYSTIYAFLKGLKRSSRLAKLRAYLQLLLLKRAQGTDKH